MFGILLLEQADLLLAFESYELVLLDQHADKDVDGSHFLEVYHG